jgi:hypothetical protein
MSYLQGTTTGRQQVASAAGWQRLADDIRAAGFEVTVTERPYSEERYGKIEHGVSRSIHMQVRNESGAFLGTVEVADKYGRMGKWYGWSVIAQGPEFVIGRPTYAVTNRPQVVASFVAAVATVRKGA